MNPNDQRLEALQAANAVRGQRDTLRRELRAGIVDWQDVIDTPPACIADMLLSEVLMMLPWVDRRRIETLGSAAARQGIALTVRCGRASQRTRDWVLANTLAASTRRARPGHDRHAGGRPGVLRTESAA